MRGIVVLLEPPALLGWSLLGLVWLAHRRSGGVTWTAGVIAAVYFWFATPLGANIMVGSIEGDPSAPRACLGAVTPDTVVALAGGVSGPSPPDPPLSRLKEASFRRTIAAAEITLEHREARLILSGGAGGPEVEAELMQRLAVLLGVPPERIVAEDGSRNTAESAARVGAILRRLGADHTHLVTSALHMPRAARSFEAQGIRVCRHPVDWRQVPIEPRFALLPQISAMEKSVEAVQEMLGSLWYGLSGRLSPRPAAHGPGRSGPGSLASELARPDQALVHVGQAEVLREDVHQ